MSIHEADQPKPIPEGPGATLRAARESKNFSLEDVSDRLLYKKEILENIEVDDYTDGTALVFLKGYLRAYAALLELDPEAIIAQFETLGLTETRDFTEVVRPQKPKRARRFKIPLTFDCRPAYLWSGIAAMTLATTGLLWAYVGGGNALPITPEPVAIEQEASELQDMTAKAGALKTGKDAEEVTEPEGKVAIKPADTNPQAESLIF